MRHRWLPLLLLVACGSSERDAPPVEVENVPDEPAAPGDVTDDTPAPEAPAEASCQASEPAPIAQGAVRHLWTVGRGEDGYALAWCNEDEAVVVRTLDRAGSPRSEARTLALPCRRVAPRIAGVGDRWVLTTHGRCHPDRARMTRCFHHVALDAAGAPIGEAVTERRTFQEGNSLATQVTTSTAVYSSQGGWDRGGGGDFSIDQKLELAEDGTLTVERGSWDEEHECWTGDCVAVDEDRVVAVLASDDPIWPRRPALYLWRSWSDETVVVRPLPWNGLQPGTLRFCDGAGWITYVHQPSSDAGEAAPSRHLARVDVETGRVESFPNQLAPAPAVPSCAEPAVVRRTRGFGVRWQDVRGAPVGALVPVGNLGENPPRVVGDTRDALAVGWRDGGELLAASVRCSADQSGAAAAREPEGEISASLWVDEWADLLAVREGGFGVSASQRLSTVGLREPGLLSVRQDRDIPRDVTLPLRDAGVFGHAWVMLGADGGLTTHRMSRPLHTSVPGGRSLTGDDAHVYVGGDDIVRVPTEGRFRPDGRLELEGMHAVDMVISRRVLYAALASDDAGAVITIDLRGDFVEAGRVALPRPPVAIDADREGVVVATSSSLHEVTRGDDGLALGATTSTEDTQDLAVSRGRVFTVAARGRVREHALGERGSDRELAPAREQDDRGTWRLRATRRLLARAGGDVALFSLVEAE